MCLYINKDQKAIIATEDIVCFKVLKKWNNKYITPYQNKKVILGKLYHSKIDAKKRDNTINKAIHSFVNLEEAKTELDSWYSPNYVIVKAIIPKDAEYYIGCFENINDCYASNQIKYIEEL